MGYYHLVGTLTGVVVESAQDLEARMDAVAKACGFDVRARSFVQFEPVGATGVLVLAESHFSAHTVPEDAKVFVDVFCCSASFDPGTCAERVERAFGAAEATWETVLRH